jgi:DNA-binding CsgD family transcriptional regulator
MDEGIAAGRADSLHLLEREHELTLARSAIAAAGGGSGCVLSLEGPAGIGKTRLLLAAGELARDDGLAVLSARGTELEAVLPWVLARALLAPALATLPVSARGRVLGGAGAGAAELFAPGEGDEQSISDAAFVARRAHALSWVVAELAQRRPILLLVDDAHWADEASLRFLGFLAARLGEMPVSMILARRPHEASAPCDSLERLTALSGCVSTGLRPLSPAAVGELLRARLGGHLSAGALASCIELTAGNPFYLSEMVRDLSDALERGESIDEARAQRSRPASVARNVRLRLDRLGAAAVGLARAAALMGAASSLRQAALLAELDADAAADAFDALAAAELLLPEEPLRFAHPLVAAAVYEDVGGARRRLMHLRAGRILAAEGVAPVRVAAHLLASPAQGEPEVPDTLRAAAAAALAEGATDVATRYLERCLQEPLAAEQRGEVLASLGRAEVSLGRSQGRLHLREAFELAPDDDVRAALLLEIGRAMILAGEPEAAAATLEQGLALPDLESELSRELQAARWMAATLAVRDVGTWQEGDRPDVAGWRDPLTRGQRQVLAQLAQQRAFDGGDTASVRALVERAWGDGELLRTEGCEGLTWSLATGGLLLVDELEREVEICDEVLRHARDVGSPMGYATACYCRSVPQLLRGAVDDALADASSALDARKDGWAAFVGAAVATFADASLERGEIAAARAALAPVLMDPKLQQSAEYGLVLLAHGRVLIAEARPAEALQTLLVLGERVCQVDLDHPALFPWRVDAALAAALLGEWERSRSLATEALARAEASALPRVRAGAHRAMAFAHDDVRGAGHLREALALLPETPRRLERVRVLAELGASLRRLHQRSEAGVHLREAMKLAAEGGALALAGRAGAELEAAGLRGSSRREARGDRLTPGELRVVRLAAEGHSNREIAQLLFVTVKAVEYHLGNSYRKLGIKRRGQLAPLARDSGAEEPSGVAEGLSRVT